MLSALWLCWETQRVTKKKERKNETRASRARRRKVQRFSRSGFLNLIIFAKNTFWGWVLFKRIAFSLFLSFFCPNSQQIIKIFWYLFDPWALNHIFPWAANLNPNEDESAAGKKAWRAWGKNAALESKLCGNVALLVKNVKKNFTFPSLLENMAVVGVAEGSNFSFAALLDGHYSCFEWKLSGGHEIICDNLLFCFCCHRRYDKTWMMIKKEKDFSPEFRRFFVLKQDLHSFQSKSASLNLFELKLIWSIAT